MMKISFVLFFTILWSFVAAGDLHFERFSVENGLSQNTVWCLMQDNQDFIWIGTKDGLNRFDGLSFKVFKTDPVDSTSIGNNFIRSLFEDKDKNIWVGTDKGLYIYNPIIDCFSKFRLKTKNDISIEQAVNSIIKDKEGNIWIGVFGQGVFEYKPKSNELLSFSNSPENVNSLSSDLVWTLFFDSREDLWIGTLGGGLNKFLPSSGTFKRFDDQGKAGNINDNSIYSLFEDSKHNFWIGSWHSGLILMDREKEEFISFGTKGPLKSLSQCFVRSINEYKPGYLIIGTEIGLSFFDTQNNKVDHYFSETLDPKSLSDDAIYSILKDVEGNFWIGTYFGGINYLVFNLKPIDHYFPSGKPEGLKGNAISHMIESSSGNIWIGTEDNGLNYFDLKNKKFTNYNSNTPGIKLSDNNLHALLLENNNLWVGTFGSGLDVINLTIDKVKNYRFSPFDTSSLSDNGVFAIYKDKSGCIWIGTIIGLNIYNSKKDNFSRIKELDLDNTYIYDIIEDDRGNVWFASYEKGLFCFNRRLGRWKNYRNNPSDQSSLSYDKVISLWCDAQGRLWIGTEGGGLCRYLYDTDSFITYNEKNGLPNNVIYSIRDDNNGNLWFTTNSGLVFFNTNSMEVKTFKKSDGIQSNQFNYKSGLKAHDGKLYFGGINGFNSFYPDSFRFNKIIPSVVFTNFQISNKEVRIGIKDSPLTKSIRFTDQITLQHDQAYISFEFIALSYIAPNKNNYAFKLENFDRQWNYIGNEHKVSYANLAPGEYTLRVKASNNDDIWNETGTSIRIKVLPPWWKSTTALFTYFIILLASVIAFERYLVKSSEKNNRLKLQRLKEQKEHEIYQMKIEFFTNIAHEIRTPLTLISGPLERLVSMNEGTDEVKQDYLLMRKNVNRLINLVNQLLDFRKIENGYYLLNQSSVDIFELLQTIYQRFLPLAHMNSINFIFNSIEKKYIIYIDNEVITKVISNLLTNAFKFAKSEIELSFSILKKEEQNLFIEIRVKDDGIGIPQEKLEKIFLPFYQVHSSEKGKAIQVGTGLGLTYARSLVELHNGSLSVKSELGIGSEFVIQIPINQEVPNMEFGNKTFLESGEINIENFVPSEGLYSKENIINQERKNLPEILIIDDNEDMLNFLKSSLQKEFSITVSTNGLDALEFIHKNNFELIISDIMMPGIDGFELCSRLKKDLRTSHIPIILLTAKTHLSSKIEGLEQGADAYIEKPFVLEYLNAQIINLIENRTRLKTIFAQQPFVDTFIIAHSKADELFVDKITEIIDTHIGDINFSVDKLATMLKMSRSGLHKKLKAISGYSPVDFVRVIRLKRAAELLSSGEFRINEICYAVGFNTPSYFAKCFQHQFGVLPKDFNKNPKP